MSERREGTSADQAGASESKGQATVSLAVQVAHIAAQVSAARCSADSKAVDALEARLAVAQARLQQQEGTPEALILFLEVMQAILRGEDVSALVGDLPTSYRAVYEQLMDEAQASEPEGSLTLGQVLDEVTRNVILAMVRGTFEQRRRMADTLLVMAEESRQRPDLAGLRDLLQAARLLLQGADTRPIAERLRGPFQTRWEEVMEAIRE